MTDLRIGYGYDVHRLVPGRALVLGGVTVPFEKGLLGHSDADVLTHAMMDALLGAAALGDIGRLFPDSDDAFLNISSLVLLSRVRDALADAGIAQDKVLGISQGWRLGGAIKTTERKLAEGQLLHGGSAMMNWCVGNARVEPKGNSILITKQASGFAKIDPLMALFNAVSLMALNPASNVFDGELLTV